MKIVKCIQGEETIRSVGWPATLGSKFGCDVRASFFYKTILVIEQNPLQNEQTFIIEQNSIKRKINKRNNSILAGHKA